ncbi:hypothetical protein BP00DRAFT_53801 [Aspergillus indologenus CBS 114.80]|uniref:Uncharacterized protein n=1 Tax=Aspergillus indologenus CBS 114.80 TaxID=1450541 RepID=A0A2V5HQ47_9EURO|nr:hypothetical protein BP00DRAFT_53801 [Aspergillus indologenus CBS 114.80]
MVRSSIWSFIDMSGFADMMEELPAWMSSAEGIIFLACKLRLLMFMIMHRASSMINYKQAICICGWDTYGIVFKSDANAPAHPDHVIKLSTNRLERPSKGKH